MEILKNILKFILLVFLTTISFIIVSALLPYSQAFLTASRNTPPTVLAYFLFANAWLCYAIVYIVRRSRWTSVDLMLGLTVTLVFVHSVMTQIETYYFRFAFPILTSKDILLIAIANAIPILTGVPAGIWLFGRKEKQSNEFIRKNFPPVRELIPKLLLIGFIYVIIYFTFGYFVAWQVPELRAFYSGNADDRGFVDSLVTNYERYPSIYPFQFLRGVLFGLLVLPLVSMFKGRSTMLLISLILVFLTVGIVLIVPNVLFPDSVRWGHFVEVMSSMLVFAVLIWLVYARLKLGKDDSTRQPTMKNEKVEKLHS